ncbi:helix-turn-helix domain-containing protein [Vulcaniibacterium tengchongense]|uniref:Transcriptional regulator n=1 Tax=Vulcaniibacterium tengchongense TaxID=1273429 RepID=A0A3N4VXH3_9GAMM|nr:helix-turn-helix transcriptional regulator [Vulcaniibacterium tengchongense]RPE81817.1 hypothetical protein EDC50_1019 [Vulcaniibacterium tengchongense]
MTEPDWLNVLRAACKCRTQSAVAEKIGYSPAVVSQVLKGTYKGDLRAVQQKVEGALMGLTVECPVIGELPRNRCLEYQRQPFASTNHMRVQLARACPTCPNRRGAE